MLLRENIQIKPFDANRNVLQVDENRHFLLNQATSDLVEILSSSTNLMEAHRSFNTVFNHSLSYGAFTDLIDHKLGGYRILKKDAITLKPGIKNTYLKLKLPLLNARIAQLLSLPLQPFFKPRVFWFSIAVISLFLVGMVFGFAWPQLSQVNYLTLLFLIYPTMLIHELGHIAACAKAKLKHGGIGFGFYFVLPVMYAEITNIWMGSKEQRIIANLGGIFAELLYAGVLGIIYLLFQSEVCLFACISISTFVLWEFNPFVRFDGYWLLSDITNTPNLVVRSKRVLLNVFSKTTFLNWKANRFKISASPQAIFLFGYGLINSFFILLLLGYTFITYQKEIIQFPVSLYQILLKISRWDLAIQDVNGALLSILLFYILSIRYLIIQYKSLIK
ncbi:hypothetical protein [Aquirufa sp.]|jgi:putative peptide zinc metalloprotease protein|uniref:hypothetical protein n=1 Tax=Aquirufa sp. TaxID=2676249 RepID=UPI0037847A70